MSSRPILSRVIPVVAAAVLGAAVLFAWKGRTPETPTSSAATSSAAMSSAGKPQAKEAVFSSSVARPQGFSAVTVEPVLIGSWRNTQTVAGVTVVTNLVLRADGTFEQVINLAKGRITRAGQYAAAGGLLRFASVTCRTDDPSQNDMLCRGPMYDSSYVLESGGLSVVVHRAKGDAPPILFVRNPGT